MLCQIIDIIDYAKKNRSSALIYVQRGRGSPSGIVSGGEGEVRDMLPADRLGCSSFSSFSVIARSM